MYKTFIFFFLCAGLSLHAQVSHRFSVAAGYQQSTIVDGQNSLLVISNTQWLYSPFGGVNYRFQSKWWELGAGLQYSRKGKVFNSLIAPGNQEKYTFEYIDIPLMYSAKPVKWLAFSAGVINSIGLKQRIILAKKDDFRNPSPYQSYQDYDLFLSVGMSIIISDRIRLSANYAKGLTETPNFGGFNHQFNSTISYDIIKK